jgi:hypothetical protein
MTAPERAFPAAHPVAAVLVAAVLATALPGCAVPARSQTNPAFNISLSIDYTAAEQTLLLLRGEYVNTRELAALRGNRVAASTSALIAGEGDAPSRLQSYLDSLAGRSIIRDDVFRLEEARENADAIGALLDELKRRNFSRMVVATVEQLFPSDIPVTAVIPVYAVALGHENADAYVRRVVWKGDEPQFTGEGEGELCIIINLAAAATYPLPPEEGMKSILLTTAHEVFHAAFGLYKDASPGWKSYYKKHASAADYLLDLVQNEGIAYYLSLEQRLGDRLPADWTQRMQESFAAFNRNTERLFSGKAGARETGEIIRSANLSGYWESYGSMTGMAMAREIDRGLGRQALIETISLGPLDFLSKYVSLTETSSTMPEISEPVLRGYGLK